MEYSTCKERLDQIHALEPKVSQLTYYQQDLKKLEKQIAVEEAKLGDSGSDGRSHIVVRREHQNALQEQLVLLCTDVFNFCSTGFHIIVNLYGYNLLF